MLTKFPTSVEQWSACLDMTLWTGDCFPNFQADKEMDTWGRLTVAILHYTLVHEPKPYPPQAYRANSMEMSIRPTLASERCGFAFHQDHVSVIIPVYGDEHHTHAPLQDVLPFTFNL